MIRPEKMEDSIWRLGGHIEFDHERELPGEWLLVDVQRMHEFMHRYSDHWDHSH